MTHQVPSRASHRMELAKREGPQALAWTGGLIAVLSVALARHGLDAVDAVHAGVVAVFVVAAVVASRPGISGRTVPWICAGAALVMVLTLEWEVWSDPTALGVAYVMLALLGFAPFVLDPLAMASAQLPMVIGFVIAVSQLDDGPVVNWLMAAVAALLLGAVILRVRLQSIDALGDATARSRAEATIDPLTHVLNRRGIEERLPELVALAGRRDEPVFTVFVDVDGLKPANDVYGHEFGDTVIMAVADAVRLTVRAADLVGRWGGDEFIVVGMGSPLPAEQLATRLRNRLVHSGIDPTMWSGEVSIGSAVGAPSDLDFDGLVASADADMYERRRRRREG